MIRAIHIALRLLASFLTWSFFIGQSAAQIHNERHKDVVAIADTVRLDTLSIVPSSVVVWNADTLVATTLWRVDYAKSQLMVDPRLHNQVLRVYYRAMPYDLGSAFAHKQKKLIAPKKDAPYKPYIIGGTSNAFNRDDGIRKSGSISRGVLVGNSQNLAVNSSLNLQLSGRITDRYELLASISDNNIPIQPDGNTSQLQDFDQVFIQLSDARGKLIAGDFVLASPFGHFLKYNKRTQGLYMNQSGASGNKTWQIETSASVSKGRFGRNVIQGIEGNQGPYRLTGADGEQFIIVLSGTETVYIDGKLLQRGLDKDYVIDYNSAEITFTPRHLITKDRRITVEFQYSEKRYARPLLQTAVQWQNDKHHWYLNAYSESDARNQPLQQDLSDADKLQLSEAGDNPLAAFTSGIQETPFTNNQVLYTQIDSLGFNQVLVYSTDSAATQYRVVFHFLGQGQGDYIEDGFAATGKKYKWLVPIWDGNQWVSQGSYAPVALLVAPKKTQMITAGHDMLIASQKARATHRHQIKTEGALSNKDLNTFSAIDNADNIGWASKVYYEFARLRGLTDSTKVPSSSFKTNIAYEYNHKNFSSIERFREVEFNRNWNLGAAVPQGTLQWAQAEASWAKASRGQWALAAQWLDIQHWGSGAKGQISGQWRSPSGFQTQITGSLLSTKGQVNSTFMRHKSEWAQTWKTARLYYRDEHENNLLRQSQLDTLSPLSYQFYDWELGLTTADTLKKSVGIYYRSRFENRWSQGQLARASMADQYGITAKWNLQSNSRLALFISNRRLRVTNPEVIATAPENTLVSRIEYNIRSKNGFIQSSTFYESGSGLEQRKEYIYLEVAPGQGNFIWVDYNANGIKELNEFETALYAYEANYIRSSIQSNTYTRTYTNQLNQTLSIQPDRLIQKPSGWRKYLARISAQSTVRLDRKNTSADPNDRFNPLMYDANDTSLLALNGLVRNVFFINKSQPIFNAEITYQSNRGKSLLSNGFEMRSDAFWMAAVRWTIQRTWTISTEIKSGDKLANSDFLNGRNYALQYVQIQPQLSWQPGNKGRLNAKAQFADKLNTLGTEHTIIRKLGVEGVWSDVKKGSLQCELNFYKIAFNSTLNNSLSFDMLEGLTAGNNLTWGISLQRTVAKNLQLSLNYNGRQPQNRTTIHAGGMQLRAFF